MKPLKHLFRGGVVGLAATLPMTAVMLAIYRLLPPEEQYALPQGEIIERLSNTVGTHEDPDVPASPQPAPERKPLLNAAALVSHFGYGAASGVAYALVMPRRQNHPLPQGLLFGIALWAVGYLGWLPALRVLTPATEHPRGRSIMMILAHLVWGPSTALLLRRMSP
jgi:uncharacterized membrane protein YagU involved in acid resistance